jgi:hypothetical protein
MWERASAPNKKHDYIQSTVLLNQGKAISKYWLKLILHNLQLVYSHENKFPEKSIAMKNNCNFAMLPTNKLKF